MDITNRFYMTSDRTELGKIIRKFALSIDPELLKGLTIAINGHMNSGKSYIWDEFRMANRTSDGFSKQHSKQYFRMAFTGVFLSQFSAGVFVSKIFFIEIFSIANAKSWEERAFKK